MVFFDVETKNFFTDGGEGTRLDTSDINVSFVGAYDDTKDKFMSFWEDDLGKLERVLKGADRVVGYNSWEFDYGVLSPHFKTDPRTLPSLDLMVAMKAAIGFRPKLDDLARANGLGAKIGKGVDAVNYWQNGELDKLEKYCLEDVRLTYEVWKRGEENGKLNYFTKSGFVREAEVNWQDGYMQNADEGVQGVLL